MNIPFFIIVAILLFVAAYQIWISVRLVNAVEYSRTQKLYQLVIIWLIPVLGAVVVHFVLFSTAHSTPSVDRAFIPQQENHSDFPPFVGHDS